MSALRSVVLPLPVPPLTRIFRRVRSTRSASWRTCSGSAPCSTSCAAEKPMARASAGLVPAGMLRASTLPASMSASRGGRSPLRAVAVSAGLLPSSPAVRAGRAWGAGG